MGTIAALAPIAVGDVYKRQELYPLWYKEAETSGGHTLRLYKERKQVDLVSLHKGRLPRSEGEITLDRLYAENNGLDVGDEIVADDETYTCLLYTSSEDG